MNRCGYLSSPFATSTMKKTAIDNNQSTKHKLWMALLLGFPLCQMISKSTIQEISNTTSQTVTALTLTTLFTFCCAQSTHTQCIEIWLLVLHTIISLLALLIRGMLLVFLDSNVWALSMVLSLWAKQRVLIWILDHTITPTFDPTVNPHFWFHVLLHSRRIVHSHKRSSDQRTINQSSSMTFAFAALNTFIITFSMWRRVRFATSRWRILLFVTSSPSTSLWLHYHQVHAWSWRLLQLC